MTVVAWTGHRPDLFADPHRAQQAVDQAADELQAERFLVGGQRGVDTWAALAAHRLGVPFALILPLAPADFATEWSAEDRKLLEQTIGWAAELRIVGGPADAAYSARNRVLAISADLLVAVWTGRTGGGTAETIAFARAHGTPIREVHLPGSSAPSRGHGV